MLSQYKGGRYANTFNVYTDTIFDCIKYEGNDQKAHKSDQPHTY